MNPAGQLVLFTLDDLRLALSLNAVERVVRAVEVTPMPDAPDPVAGIINVQGRVMPVVALRKRLGLPPREMELNDQFIIAGTLRGAVALWVDAVTGIEACGETGAVAAERLPPGAEFVEGVVKRADGLVLVCSAERLVSLTERRRLEAAPAQAGLAQGDAREALP
ncbi:MAG: purine-binding chemotaxis protein CheW [Verrucomicrobia bacterium]|nr:purine-binding chemotaxis protein CheW [Verrucomicrobiota bacterium]